MGPFYIALFMYYCTPKALYSHVGSLLNHHQCEHPLEWCHSTTAPMRSPHTSYRWREEGRVIQPIWWMGIIRRPWLARAIGGNVARSPGIHPYSLREVPWDFYDHRESGPCFYVSSEWRDIKNIF